MTALDNKALHEIARTALRSWGISSPRLQLISHSENTVFRVAAGSGPVAVYHYLDHPDFNAIVAALAAGYREERPLDGRELDALPHFLTIRSLARLGWVQQRPDLNHSKELPGMIELGRWRQGLGTG